MRARCSWFWLRMLWAGLCLPATLPAAVTNYVTSTADSGAGSLRQAIYDVNAAGGGKIVFSNITSTLLLSNFLPAFAADTVLIGPGTNFQTMTPFATFQINTQVVVRFCRIHFGSTAYFDNRGTVIVSACVAPDNLSLGNNGEFRTAACSQPTGSGRLNISGSGTSIIQDQRYSRAVVTGGSADLVNCTFVGGSVAGLSATVNCYQGPFCPPLFFWCCDVTRAAETALGGGFLIVTGVVNLSGCTIANNSVQGGDGESIPFPHPTVTPPGQGSGGGICLSNGILRMTNCTVSGNFAAGGGKAGTGYANGGGICIFRGTATLVNCTISYNHANGGGFAGSAGGGGVYVDYADVQIINCTITGNTATPTVGGATGPFSYVPSGIGIGGLYSYGTLIQNSIISGNIGAQSYTNQPGFMSVPNDGAGRVVSLGRNLIGTTNSLISTYDIFGGFPHGLFTNFFAGFSDFDVINMNPLLGPLQDNGGPVFTHALLAGSPAIDAGTNSGLSFDARGQPRTIDNPAIPNAAGGDGTDIGAFEVNHILTATEVRAVGSDILVRFTSVSDKTYGVQYKSEVNGPAWITLPGTVSGTGGIVNYTDVGAANLPRRFYRLFERTR